MDVYFLTEGRSSFPIVYSIALNRIGKTVNIIDRTVSKLMKFVVPRGMAYPYFYSDETLLTDATAVKREADINLYILDKYDKKLLSRVKPEQIVVITGMLLREARALNDAFIEFFDADGKLPEGFGDKHGKFLGRLVVDGYLESKYTHRAIQDALGLRFPIDNVHTISYTPGNVRTDIAIDLSSKVKLAKLSKEYRMAVGALLRYETEDGQIIRKLLHV